MRRIFLIPVYNECKTMPTILDELRRIGRFGDHLIIVNDGSTDDTFSILSKFHHEKMTVHLIHHKRNRGLSRAMGSGLRYVAQLIREKRAFPDDLVINFDGDGQHDISIIGAIEKRFEKTGAHAIFLQREMSLYPFHKRFGNRLMSLCCSILCGHLINDGETGFRCFKAYLALELAENIIPYRYSCAQQMVIYLCLRGVPFHFKMRGKILYYRSNTRLIDAFANPLVALFLRLKLFSKKGLKEMGVKKSKNWNITAF